MPHYILNGIGKLGPKHQEVMDCLFQPDRQVRQVDLCCGRGFGKTVLAVVVAVRALCSAENQVGLFLEPDWASIHDVFLDTWQKIVPSKIYTINHGKRRIEMINGSFLFYGPRNVSGSPEAMRNKYRGRNLHFVIDDEAAVGCDRQQYTNTLAAIRNPGPVRFYFTISTPMLGAYRALITSPKHRLFRGTSKDNQYRPHGYVENLLANMSEVQARREVYGEFISLEGRIWKTADLTKDWPEGNTHAQFRSFDSKKPWWLFCDLGSATAAYVIVQQTDATYRGRKLFPGPVWVAVADFCPSSDGSAMRAFNLLKESFGTPAGVVAGADINTRDNATGRTIAYFAQQVWGNVRVYPCSESMYHKQVQYDTLSNLIKLGDGRRRFCVAKDFAQLNPRSERGLVQMLNEDEWPEEMKIRPGAFLPKGAGIMLSHVRDAMLMGSVMIMSPPTWTGLPDMSRTG